jgi:hypothetical protein
MIHNPFFQEHGFKPEGINDSQSFSFRNMVSKGHDTASLLGPIKPDHSELTHQQPSDKRKTLNSGLKNAPIPAALCSDSPQRTIRFSFYSHGPCLDLSTTWRTRCPARHANRPCPDSHDVGLDARRTRPRRAPATTIMPRAPPKHLPDRLGQS